MNPELPAETKVVIGGGGIASASIAYHLTKLGWKDVLLLEQNKVKRAYRPAGREG